ncbi:MAG: stage II sporulation protein M [Clostridia bacterium]|nr:stage II sporulation protein M [Clostridia bacterium]MDD4375957.1 stage II sporulation protein M [Clostridia bacterium]
MFKRWLKRYINEKRKIIIILLVSIIAGIIAGVLLYNFSVKEEKTILREQIIGVMQSYGKEVIKTNVIYNGIKNNVGYILMLFIFSIMMFGNFLICFWFAIKGIAIGIYISILFGMFGPWWGILITVMLVILVNIVYLPAMIYIGTTFIDYNSSVFDKEKNKFKNRTLSGTLVKTMFGMGIILSSIILESIMSNWVAKIYISINK